MDPGQSYVVETDSTTLVTDGVTDNKIYVMPSEADFVWFEATTQG